MEKLIMTQALDERDFLKKKIQDKISSRFNVMTVVVGNDNFVNGKSIEQFESDAKADFQSINDMIDRYNRIVRAITLSNANTKITVDGQEITMAEAITLRKEFYEGSSFTRKLNAAIDAQLSRALNDLERRKSEYNRVRNNYIEKLIGTNGIGGETTISEDQVKIIDAMTAQYEPRLINPLNITESRSGEKESQYIKNLETAMKISNATTVVEF